MQKNPSSSNAVPVEGGVQVAAHQLRGAQADLADLPRIAQLAVDAHEAQLDTVHRRAVGAAQHVVGVGRRRHRDVRGLGRPVPPQHRHPEHRPDLVGEVLGAVDAVADEGTHGREERLDLVALALQVHGVELTVGSRERDPFAGEHLDDAAGVDGVAHDAGAARLEAREQPHDPRHLGHRRDEPDAVPVDQPEPATQATGRGQQRCIGVLDDLRSGGGPGGGEQEADLLVLGKCADRPGLQQDGISLGQRPVGEEHAHRPVATSHLGRHRLVVHTVQLGRGHQQRRAEPGGDRFELRRAERGRQRVLHHVQPAERRHEDERFDPGRELPRRRRRRRSRRQPTDRQRPAPPRPRTPRR